MSSIRLVALLTAFAGGITAAQGVASAQYLYSTPYGPVYSAPVYSMPANSSHSCFSDDQAGQAQFITLPGLNWGDLLVTGFKIINAAGGGTGDSGTDTSKLSEQLTTIEGKVDRVEKLLEERLKKNEADIVALSKSHAEAINKLEQRIDTNTKMIVETAETLSLNSGRLDSLYERVRKLNQPFVADKKLKGVTPVFATEAETNKLGADWTAGTGIQIIDDKASDKRVYVRNQEGNAVWIAADTAFQ
jgi:hypothetical protein